MNEKTNERIEAEKAAVNSMRGSVVAMRKTLDRVEALEEALNSLISRMESMKHYIPESAYRYNSSIRAHEEFEGALAKARKVL
jgi:hypothetical protein